MTSLETELREDFDAALVPLKAGKQRVDRVKKILYGVLMCGLHSGNTHGVEGVTGTDYELQAIRDSMDKFEGLPGYANHPPKPTAGQPTPDRSIYDALGMHRNVRATAQGRVSDFHLVPHHPLCESILDAAENENLSGLYAFSHHAYGGGEVRGDRYVVTNIQKAFSVDVVYKGSTTKTFWESPDPTNNTEQTMSTIRESNALSIKILTACGMKAEGPLLEAMNSVPDLDGKLKIFSAVKNFRTPIAPAKSGTRPSLLQESGAYEDLYGAPLAGGSGRRLQEAGVNFDDLYGSRLR